MASLGRRLPHPRSPSATSAYDAPIQGDVITCTAPERGPPASANAEPYASAADHEWRVTSAPTTCTYITYNPYQLPLPTITTPTPSPPRATAPGSTTARCALTTTLFRAVGQHEADDIAAAGGYRNAPGREGEYFFRTREQAEQYGQMMNKAPGFGASNFLTSGSVPTRALGSAEGKGRDGGPGLFFRGDLSDFFDVSNHGLIP